MSSSNECKRKKDLYKDKKKKKKKKKGKKENNPHTNWCLFFLLFLINNRKEICIYKRFDKEKQNKNSSDATKYSIAKKKEGREERDAMLCIESAN